MSGPQSDQTKLKGSFDKVFRALSQKPSLGQTTHVSTTRLRRGLCCEIREDGWRFEADMPEQAGGQGEAPTPGMLGRAALGSCLAISYMLWASRRDVPVTDLKVEIQADSDDGGLFGTADIAPGYAQVRYCVTVESSASEEAVIAVLDEAERHSPWLDVFTRPVDCRRQVRLVASEGT